MGDPCPKVGRTFHKTLVSVRDELNDFHYRYKNYGNADD